MKRAFRFSLYLLVAWSSFLILACTQTQFTGTVIRSELQDVQVRFNDGEFQSIYEVGTNNFRAPSVSSKCTVATIKVVVGDKDVNVKIRGANATPSPASSVEFLRKLNLKTGENVIPIIAYRDSEEKGYKFNIYIDRKQAEGALRLTHLKCKYVSFPGKDGSVEYIDTDELIDELPIGDIAYKRTISTDKDFAYIEVASPEMEEQIVEVGGARIKAISSIPSDPNNPTSAPSPIPGDYKMYEVPLKASGATTVDITVRDTNKDLYEHFYLELRPIDKDEREATGIAKVMLNTEDGDVFDFESLDMRELAPYKKGVSKDGSSSIEIDNIFKLRELLLAPFNGTKPTLTVVPEVPGSRVELLAFWREIDHDQHDPVEGREGFILPLDKGWEYYNEGDFEDSAKFPDMHAPVFLGKSSDSEVNFVMFSHRKFDFLIKVTSPDGTKFKYHEVKFNFPFGGVYFFHIEPFRAMASKDGHEYAKSVVVKEDYEEDLYNVYVPQDCKSVRIVADDRLHVNLATGYRTSYRHIWDYRFYMSLDDGPFSRRHPAPKELKTDRNYREIPLNYASGIEEHDFSIVTYQDGELKDGRFVDEYGKESGVLKLQLNFRFRFIRENRGVAPSLSVLKVEGTQSVPSTSAVNGKIWPTFSFRPAVHDYALSLVEKDVSYKLKMLKVDGDSQIFVDGEELTTKETFVQKTMNVSERFPEEINDLKDSDVEFYSYELKQNDERYYENGRLKPCTIKVGVRKGELYREYSLDIRPVNPEENDATVRVLDAVGGSPRNGTRILYREHVPNKEIRVTTEGKLYEGDFYLLGTTGFHGTISGRGKLKAGKYYDIYALGNDIDLADSMISHYYVTGEEDESVNIVQMSLVQNGGADYHGGGGKAIRGNCPVRLKKQVATKGTAGNPDTYHDGDFFFFRQMKLSSGGSLGGGGGSWQLKPVNLTHGDAHIKMDDSSSNPGALTDMVAWFDVSLGNSIEPVAWGPEGVMAAFDTMPFSYSYYIRMTDYNPNGQIGMNESAVQQQSRMAWDFETGCYDLILVAYDVAGNRLERHQFVSIEAYKMLEGHRVGDDDEKDERRIKIENLKAILFRWPTKMNIFDCKNQFEKLFGMPWTEYTPPDGQGDSIKTPSTCLVMVRCYIGDDFGGIPPREVSIYRRCVDDNTPFKKVAATIPELRLGPFSAIDPSLDLEVGKTYQYKMVAILDEGNAVESDYLAEVTVPPSVLYFLDSIKVEGQGGGVADGAVYKYNANKKDKKIPVLKTKKYASDVKDKDKTRIKIDYRARLSSPELWDKDKADQIELGITLCKRDNDIMFASKCFIAFDDDGDEVLLIFIPTHGRYLELSTLIKKGWVPKNTTVEDLISFDKKTGLLTIKDAYLRIPMANWAVFLSTGNTTFEYEPGNTYYWDVVSFGRVAFGGYVTPMSFVKTFDAKKKNAPSEKYLDEDGDTYSAGVYLVTGNGEYDGNNSVNGKCRFTVVEE